MKPGVLLKGGVDTKKLQSIKNANSFLEKPIIESASCQRAFLNSSKKGGVVFLAVTGLLSGGINFIVTDK